MWTLGIWTQVLTLWHELHSLRSLPRIPLFVLLVFFVLLFYLIILLKPISLPFGIRKLCGACAPAERSGDSAWRLPNDPSFSSRARGQPQAHRQHRAQISRELHSKPSALPPTHFSLPFSFPPLFPTGNATPSSYSSARQFLDSCLPSRAGE